MVVVVVVVAEVVVVVVVVVVEVVVVVVVLVVVVVVVVSSSGSSSHNCQEEATDARKGKRKRVTNFNINKKVVGETGDSHPPEEDELSEKWSASIKNQIQRSENTKDARCILKAVGAISKVTNTLIELKNAKNLNTTTLSKNLSTMVHDSTDSPALPSQIIFLNQIGGKNGLFHGSLLFNLISLFLFKHHCLYLVLSL